MYVATTVAHVHSTHFTRILRRPAAREVYMKARLLLALAAVVLGTAACGESITTPISPEHIAPLLSTDSVQPSSDGPIQGTGHKP